MSIRILDLTKVYGSIRAVDGVSLEVPDGLAFGLLGPNAAGKTTLLRLLTTISRPTSGRAWVQGFDVARQGCEVRRVIGVVAQQNNLDNYLTARENLVVHAKMHGLSPRDYNPRINELLAFFDLSARQHETPKHYSNGMARRLALARALVQQPQVLFLDEPTTGLDPQGRRAVWEYIQSLREKVIVFLTTHYMEEADALCDRVAVIDRGRILVDDSPAALKRKVGEGQRYEIELLGSPEAYQRVWAGLAGAQARPSGDGRWLLTLPADIPLRSVLDRFADSDVVQVTRREPTLEDVFIQLTGRRLRD